MSRANGSERKPGRVRSGAMLRHRPAKLAAIVNAMPSPLYRSAPSCTATQIPTSQDAPPPTPQPLPPPLA